MWDPSSGETLDEWRARTNDRILAAHALGRMLEAIGGARLLIGVAKRQETREPWRSAIDRCELCALPCLDLVFEDLHDATAAIERAIEALDYSETESEDLDCSYAIPALRLTTEDGSHVEEKSNEKSPEGSREGSADRAAAPEDGSRGRADVNDVPDEVAAGPVPSST